jgi:hypothetical protein
MLHLDTLVPFLSANITDGSKSACTSIGRMNRWAPCTTGDSPIHPQEHKPVQSLGRFILPPPPPTKLKNTQWTLIKHRQWRRQVEHWNCPRKGAGQRTKCTVPNSKWTNTRDKPFLKAGKVVDYRTNLLNQRAAVKTELPHLAGGGDDQTAAAEG